MFDSPQGIPTILAPDCFYARPLLHGLEDRLDVRLKTVHSDTIDDAVAAGKCACALVPPAALLRNPQLSVLPGAGVVAKHDTPTERLVGNVPLEHMRTIAVEATARHLETSVRILFAERGLEQPVFIADSADDGGSSDARLVSGDTGLKYAASPGQDLGALWHETTGLPMVLALWVCGPMAPYRLLRQVLAEASRAGEERLAGDAQDPERNTMGLNTMRTHLYYRLLSLESDSVRALHELARKHAIGETIVESIAFC